MSPYYLGAEGRIFWPPLLRMAVTGHPLGRPSWSPKWVSPLSRHISSNKIDAQVIPPCKTEGLNGIDAANNKTTGLVQKFFSVL